MSARTMAIFLPLAAMLGLLTIASPAAAFSQIGAEDGSTGQKDGIVAVPLPPLEGAAPVATGESGAAPTEPATTGTTVKPAAAPATQPTTDAPATLDPGTSATESTDEGEGEPAAAEPGTGTSEPEDGAEPLLPSTPPVDAPSTAAPGEPATGGPSDAEGSDTAEPGEAVPPAEVFYGEDGLPSAVRDLRAKLIEIARTGEIEALRPYIEPGEDGTVLTFGGTEDDPITFLKSASGDGDGVEILAILLEVLQAGHVRSEPDSDNEIFVWPYFTGVPIDKLTKPQKVELFELVTAGDYQEMLGFGAYNFYRAGISPDGKLQFFVAGD